MKHPYRENQFQRPDPVDLDSLEPERGARIKKLLMAYDELLNDKARIMAELKHYPVEINIGEHYRVILAESSEFEIYLERIHEEAERLKNPSEIMWDHMNLLSGRKTGKPPAVKQITTKTRTLTQRIIASLRNAL